MVMEFKYLDDARNTAAIVRDTIDNVHALVPEGAVRIMAQHLKAIESWISENLSTAPTHVYHFVVFGKAPKSITLRKCTFTYTTKGRCNKPTDFAIDDYITMRELANKQDPDVWFMRTMCRDCIKEVERLINIGTWIECVDCGAKATCNVKSGISSKRNNYLCTPCRAKDWDKLRRKGFISIPLNQ